jgi:hypothetical protein
MLSVRAILPKFSRVGVTLLFCPPSGKRGVAAFLPNANALTTSSAAWNTHSANKEAHDVKYNAENLIRQNVGPYLVFGQIVQAYGRNLLDAQQFCGCDTTVAGDDHSRAIGHRRQEEDRNCPESAVGEGEVTRSEPAS